MQDFKVIMPTAQVKPQDSAVAPFANFLAIKKKILWRFLSQNLIKYHLKEPQLKPSNI